MAEMRISHRPVLLERAVEALRIKPDGIYLDGTFGRGGHSRSILERLNEQGRLIAVDRDPQAIAFATTEFEFAGDARFMIVRESFEMLADVAERTGVMGRVDGLLLDLGVSSPQLDQAHRGFSFQQDGPLDMRMDPDSGPSAAEWLASAKTDEIADVLKRYGEERHARRIARAIVDARGQGAISTTRQLAEIVAQANPSWERDKHPATRSFQAIRIFINRELEALQHCLQHTPEILKAGGRLAVISFHSLEDRLVKRFMRDQAKGDRFPPGLPVTQDQLRPKFSLVGKAIQADVQEVADNPRARSAVLRVAERLA